MKSRKLWLVACGLWLVACGLFAGNKVMSQEGNEKNRDNNETLVFTTVRKVGSYPSLLRTALTRKIISNKGVDEIGFDEIRKFDFSFPQSPDYTNDKEWSVFSEEDVIDVEGYKAIEESVASNASHYIITLSNRIFNVGTERPELLAILPGVKKDVCESVFKTVNDIKYSDPVNIPSLETKPNLNPYNYPVKSGEIVTLPKSAQPSVGCVESKSSYYYYQIIREF